MRLSELLKEAKWYLKHTMGRSIASPALVWIFVFGYYYHDLSLPVPVNLIEAAHEWRKVIGI